MSGIILSLKNKKTTMTDKCNCHHWVCGCNFTVGHDSNCKDSNE